MVENVEEALKRVILGLTKLAITTDSNQSLKHTQAISNIAHALSVYHHTFSKNNLDVSS